ncbi:MAG: hypothetical protein AB1411_11760 [Nitrospirota bacterium]
MSWLVVFISSALPVVLLLVILAADRWRRVHSRMLPVKVRQRGPRNSAIR